MSTKFYRSNRGQSLIMIASLIGLTILPLLAVFTFEVARVYLFKQELQNACDASSLAAVATLASADNTNPTLAHQNAIEAGLGVFKKNFVGGKSLNHVVKVDSVGTLTAAPGEAKVFYQFLNPLTNAIEDISSPNAKVVKTYGTFGGLLSFGKYIGISSLAVNAVSTGQVPQFDVVVCFDVSGSMDDQTNVTCVKRKWDPTLGGGKVVYELVTGKSGLASGKIYDVVKPEPTGSSLNGVYPQLLSESYWNANLYFTEYLAKYYGIAGLRSAGGYPDAGQPPGNYPPGNAFTWDGWDAFTDLVVNIDGNSNFTGFTYDGYSFPDLNTLVEASRGNLESQSVFTSSKANTSVSVSPRPGYQKAYLEAAASRAQPMKDAKDALVTLTDVLNTDADTHFGLVSFDSAVGTDVDSKEKWFNIDQTAQYGVKQDFPLPRVKVTKQKGNTNYGVVNTSIKSCVAMGSTNIGGALHEAVQDLKNDSRTGSVKAVILFTDGEPTLPCGPLDPSNPLNNARLAAVEARDAGIPVYTVGLAQNPAIINDQIAILNDTDKSPASGGIAGIAGHGGSFTLVTNSKDLRAAFQKIARHLVRLVAHEGA